MHTKNLILLSAEDMRQIAGGDADPTDLPNLPPVRVRGENDDPLAFKDESGGIGPRVSPPGLDVAEMMRRKR